MYKFYGVLLYFILRIIKMTLKIKIVEEEKIDGEETYVCGFWHRKLIIALFCLDALEKKAGLASPSKDGELIAVPLKLMGHKMVRGSTGKDSVKSVVQIIKLIKEGYSLGTPLDGPKGPPFVAKKGMIYVAQKTGKPLIFLGGAYEKKWIFSKTWDKFQLPKPFSKVVCVVGKRIYIPKGEDIKKYQLLAEKELERINKIAEEELKKIK